MVNLKKNLIIFGIGFNSVLFGIELLCDLEEVGINSPHQIKFIYAKIEFKKKLDNVIEYHQASKNPHKN